MPTLTQLALAASVLPLLSTSCLKTHVKPNVQHTLDLVSRTNTNVFNVEDYGAVGDNSTDCTGAFRMATAAAANYTHSSSSFSSTSSEELQRGITPSRATVLVPNGTFITGAFNLSSFVTLQLQSADTTIVGASKDDDVSFPVVPPLPSYGKARDGQPARYQALIMATDAEGVKIQGNGGVIDGGKRASQASVILVHGCYRCRC